MKDEKFDRKIKNLTESYKENPERDLWEAIEMGLNRKKRITIVRIISYSLSAAAILIAAFLITINIFRSDIPETNTILADSDTINEKNAAANNLTANISKITSISDKKAVESKGESIKNDNARETEIKETIENSHLSEKISAETKSDNKIAVIKSIHSQYTADNIPVVSGTIHSKKISLIKSYEIVSPEEEENYENFEETPFNKLKGEFVLSAGGDLSAAYKSGNVHFYSSQHSMGINNASANYGIFPISKPHHYFPISAGLELSYFFLNNRFGMGTGINYTYLESRYEALIDNDYQAKVTQKLNYLGIPLNFYFNVISNEYCYFYLSVGGLMERAVGLNYSMTNLDGMRFTRSNTPNGLQWSANIGVGFEYRFVKFMGIYVDPRLSYFFDCNQPYSVRVEQPLQFKLELGLRFHLK